MKSIIAVFLWIFINQSNTIIEFDEVKIEFLDVETWSPNFQTNIRNDTIIFELDLASSVEGKLIEISNDNEILNIKQKYETSITLMNEGPHLDLVNWKHYISEWKPIGKLKDGRYVTNTYNEVESKKFPEIKMDEVYNYIEKVGDEQWLKHAKSSNSIYEYPFAVRINRYYFKITMKDDMKIVVFNMPMGC